MTVTGTVFFTGIPLLILILVLFFIGLMGAIVPGLPGPPVAWCGMLAAHWCTLTNTSWVTVIITGVFALIITILDFVLQPWLTKKFGGHKGAVWGATIGLIVSLIFGAAAPWLILVGPFAGAYIGEKVQGSDSSSSFKAACGAFAGFLLGTGIKIICVFAYLWIVIAEMASGV